MGCSFCLGRCHAFKSPRDQPPVCLRPAHRVLEGPNQRRDGETYSLLVEWMQRPRRDFGIDLRSKYESCGQDRACRVIPVAERVRSDFLWQRSPFQIVSGGDGFIENAGIDFVLPYWMARVYGVI